MGITTRRRHDPPPAIPADTLARIDAMTPEEIQLKAEADPDNPPMTDDEADRVIFARAVRRVRELSGLSQPVFAERYHIALGRLRDWEQARYKPDSVAAAYIKAIRHDPKAIERALAADD
jgi:putative transcriptional regulator